MNTRIMMALIAFLASAGSAFATPIVEGTGTFTYSYSVYNPVTSAVAPDPNAVLSGTQFYDERPGNQFAYYTTSNFLTTTPSTGDVTYTFNASPGTAFSGSITVSEYALIAYNPGASITETVTPNNAAPTVNTILSTSSSPPDSGRYEGYYTNSISVNGATSFTIDFTLVDNVNSPYTQVFRGSTDSTNTPPPFVVTGAVVIVPEPTGVALFGFGAFSLLAVARRRGCNLRSLPLIWICKTH